MCFSEKKQKQIKKPRAGATPALGFLKAPDFSGGRGAPFQKVTSVSGERRKADFRKNLRYTTAVWLNGIFRPEMHKISKNGQRL